MELPRKAARWVERAISILKYLIALVVMLSGVTTMFSPLTPMDGALGFIYANRNTLVALGIVFFICGGMLLYGKLRKSRVWTGRGLMAVYCCYLFGTIIQGIAFNWMPEAWVGNFIMTLVTGALWVRWKVKTEYIDPNHFKDAVELRYRHDKTGH